MFALASWLTNTQAGRWLVESGPAEVKRARIVFDTRGRSIVATDALP